MTIKQSMIASLSGILRSKGPTEVLLDVNGVGYAVSIPISTFEKLGAVNSPAMLFTHLSVREDALQLYGFATLQERELFRLLTSITGIGPKIALGILSGITGSELKNYITTGNIAALTAIPNVGKKTAERLIIELRDKMDKLSTGDLSSSSSHPSASVREQALLALTSLGYQRTAAEQAIRRALNEKNGASLSIEELVKQALRHAISK